MNDKVAKESTKKLVMEWIIGMYTAIGEETGKNAWGKRDTDGFQTK